MDEIGQNWMKLKVFLAYTHQGRDSKLLHTFRQRSSSPQNGHLEMYKVLEYLRMGPIPSQHYKRIRLTHHLCHLALYFTGYFA